MGIRGEVRVEAIHVRTGEVRRIHRGHNLFLAQGYELLNKIFGGDAAAASDFIKYAQFGTGTEPAELTDTVLQSPVAPFKAVTVELDDANLSLTASVYLTAAEGNGFTLSEAGLLSAGYKLMARATITPFQKTSDWLLRLVWQVYYDEPTA